MGQPCKDYTDCCDPGKLKSGAKLYPKCRVRGMWFWERFENTRCERTTNKGKFDYVDVGKDSCNRVGTYCVWSTDCCAGMSCKWNYTRKQNTCHFPPDVTVYITLLRSLPDGHLESRKFEEPYHDHREVIKPKN